MLYNITTGWAGIRKRDNHEIVIMVSSLYRLQKMPTPTVPQRHSYRKIALYSAITYWIFC
jgi:hypothetical protein